MLLLALCDAAFDRRDRHRSSMWNNAQWNSRRDVLQSELRVIPIKGKRNCAVPFPTVPFVKTARGHARARVSFVFHFHREFRTRKNSVNAVQTYKSLSIVRQSWNACSGQREKRKKKKKKEKQAGNRGSTYLATATAEAGSACGGFCGAPSVDIDFR